MLPRASVIRLSSWKGPYHLLHSVALLFRYRRIDFSDPAQAVRFGRMRSRDEGSADLGRVPAGLNTEAQRFFCHDVTGREILHQVLSFGPFDPGRTNWVKCSVAEPEYGRCFGFCSGLFPVEPGKVRKHRG